MDERSFQRLLRRTVAIPVTLLVLLAVTLLVEILTLTSSLKWVDHAEQVISNSRQLMRYMVDMETGVRGYHLTGDKSFLDPYEAAKARIPEQQQLLFRLTTGSPDQQRRAEEIQDLNSRWINYSEGLLRQPVGGGLSSKEFETGKALMDQIRAKQRQFIAVEEQVRDVRYRRATILGNLADGTAVGLSLLVAFLLFTLTRRELYALSSTYERHLRAEAEKTQQLTESRKSYQITLRSIGDAVVSTDAEGKVSFVNPVAQQLTAWDYQGALGRPLQEVLRIVDEKTRSEIDDPVQAVRYSRGAVGLSNNLLLIDRTSREYPIELNAAPILNDRRQLVGVVIVFRDVTERRRAEQTLRSSERLAQAGRLSATIAHEIRNPLDTVANLIYLLRHEQEASEASAQYLEMASDELTRIAQITGQLLTFHREARTPVDVDLADVLQSVLVLHAPQIRRGHIKVEQRLEARASVRGFPGELRQVFSNLVGNAIDAMPHGGKLILHIRESSHAADPACRGVRVTVLDTGAGISLGVRRNLFAPFYTTKGEKGTGLGLWVSRGIIEKHEGTIYLRSCTRPGKSGSAFSVFLPFEQRLGMLDVPGMDQQREERDPGAGISSNFH
jgi:PAS domain S-box-containing protein